jgi:hypothetical protein
MINDRDIWKAALAMVRRYGDKARLEAITRMIAAYEDGSHEPVLIWDRVIRAIDRLQTTEPLPGEHVQ